MIVPTWFSKLLKQVQEFTATACYRYAPSRLSESLHDLNCKICLAVSFCVHVKDLSLKAQAAFASMGHVNIWSTFQPCLVSVWALVFLVFCISINEQEGVL